MNVRATPAQLAAAWRAFRGDRKGALLGPGPGFAEAIEAALALDPLAERVKALEAEVARLNGVRPGARDTGVGR